MKLLNKRNAGLILSLAFIGFLVWSTVEFQLYFSKILTLFQNLSQRNEDLSILIFIGISALFTMLSSFIRVLPVPLAKVQP